jgi:hypothetical protein
LAYDGSSYAGAAGGLEAGSIGPPAPVSEIIPAYEGMTQGAPAGLVPGIAWPVADPSDGGVLLPATAVPMDLVAYDPWTWAQLAAMADHSSPEVDAYGAAVIGDQGSIVAEWGGMPNPSRDYQDVTNSVVSVPFKPPNARGPNGTYYGGQQTAWQYAYQPPAEDYSSTIFLGVGQ